MEIIQVYKCLCDGLRLRILNLLQGSPLCVCHLVDILDADQVKISKQLRYMKELGMLNSRRDAQWMIYNISENVNPMLLENLKCLQDYQREDLCFKTDIVKRDQIISQIKSTGVACPEAVVKEGTTSATQCDC